MNSVVSISETVIVGISRRRKLTNKENKLKKWAISLQSGKRMVCLLTNYEIDGKSMQLFFFSGNFIERISWRRKVLLKSVHFTLCFSDQYLFHPFAIFLSSCLVVWWMCQIIYLCIPPHIQLVAHWFLFRLALNFLSKIKPYSTY